MTKTEEHFQHLLLGSGIVALVLAGLISISWLKTRMDRPDPVSANKANPHWIQLDSARASRLPYGWLVVTDQGGCAYLPDPEGRWLQGEAIDPLEEVDRDYDAFSTRRD